jgi:uncharacterized caspase-like protein
LADESLAQAPTAGKKYAIVVGINKYEHANLPPLKYAVSDASALGKELAKAGYEVIELTDSAGANSPSQVPSRANIEKSIRTFLDKSKAGDTVLVALAGHGLQFMNDKDAYFSARTTPGRWRTGRTRWCRWGGCTRTWTPASLA